MLSISKESNFYQDLKAYYIFRFLYLAEKWFHREYDAISAGFWMHLNSDVLTRIFNSSTPIIWIM